MVMMSEAEPDKYVDNGAAQAKEEKVLELEKVLERD